MSVRVILNSVNGELIVTNNFFSWAEKNNEISKSKTYTGVIITTSLEMQFGGNALTYIKALNDEYDIAAECEAEIQNYDDLNGWVTDFKGYLDFKVLPFANSQGNNTVTISAYSSTIADKLLERDKIEIPYDRLTTLDDKAITPFTKEYYDIEVLGMEQVTNGSGDFELVELLDPNKGYVDNFWPSIAWETNDINIVDTIQYAECNIEKFGSDVFTYFADKIQSNINLKLKLSYSYTEPINDTGITTFHVIKAKKLTDGTLNTHSKDIELSTISSIYTKPVTNPGSNTTVQNDIDIDIDFTLGVDYGLYFVLSRVVGGCFGGVMTILSNDLAELNISSKAEPTPCKFVSPIQAFNRTVNAICNDSNLVDSDYFDLENESVGALSFLTNGSLMRQFPIGHIQDDENKVAQLSFSLKKLYENLNKAFNLGLGVYYNEDESRYKIRIEQKEYFYQDTIILEIPKELIEEKSFKKDRDLDFYYNEINAGYKYEKPEEASGLEEYNSEINNSTPAPNDNELDLVLDYVGSGYPIEFARRIPFAGNKTTDYKYDRDNIIFNVYPNGADYIQRTTENFISITGIDGIETPINLELTGKRSFYRWSWWFNVGLRGYKDKSIKYNTSEITTDLETELDGDGYSVKENKNNTPIANLSASKFSGFVNMFNAPLGSATFKLLEANPYSIIKHWDFIKNDWSFSWIIRASNKPSDKSTNFELLEAINITDGDGFRILEDGGYRLLEDGGYRTIV